MQPPRMGGLIQVNINDRATLQASYMPYIKGGGLFVPSKTVKDKFVPVICFVSPALTYFISENSKTLFFGYVFDNELIIVNGLITFLGLLLISKKAASGTRF